MISKIEVALRVRLVEALLIHGEPLVLQDSSIFKEKKLYWQNMSTVASEIARSNDVFIKHNFDNHEGEVPVWAVVEVLSFGTLSKIIKNLKTGTGSSYSILAANYQYKSKKGNLVNPSQKMLASRILPPSMSFVRPTSWLSLLLRLSLSPSLVTRNTLPSQVSSTARNSVTSMLCKLRIGVIKDSSFNSLQI